MVDDVHLCLRIADLLEGLTSSIRNKFVRLPAQAPRSPQMTRSSPAQGHNPRYDPAMRSGPDELFQRQYLPGHGALTPLAGVSHTHTNPNDTSITIMPPPGGSYSNYDFNSSNGQSFPHQQMPQQGDPYPLDSSNASNLPFPSEEDWLTLDLQPLLDTPGFGMDNNSWYGAFGPETHNNLEVLGKLVNEQWQPGDLGFQ